MPIVPARERAIWATCVVALATILIGTGFTSTDGDSALHAALAEQVAHQPVPRWIAPEWRDLWPTALQTGYYREHPAGILLLPALLDRIGIPAAQGAYVVGVIAGLAALILASWLINRLSSRADARAALVLLQVMPLAFIFRIRANHEYPMLVCLLLTIAGVEWVRRSWWGIAAVAIGLAGGLLIKGVFVVLIVLAAGLWILVNPTGARGDRTSDRTRPLIAAAAGLAALVAVALAYDALYVRVTGETFWAPYWRRQIGSVSVASPLDDAGSLFEHAGFYLSRLIWQPAPWSLALFGLMWRAGVKRRASGPPARPARLSSEARALAFAIGFAVLTVIVLSPSHRVAERYAFSASFVVGAAGVVAALRLWPALGGAVARADARIPALPALVWVSLMLVRLASGPFLPKIS